MRLKDCVLVSAAQGVSTNHPHWLIPAGRIQEGMRREVSKTIQSLHIAEFAGNYFTKWRLFLFWLNVFYLYTTTKRNEI